MKPLSIYDEDHEYLDQEKERTGVPIVKQIQFMIRQLKKDKQREEINVLRNVETPQMAKETA